MCNDFLKLSKELQSYEDTIFLIILHLFKFYITALVCAHYIGLDKSTSQW